MRCLALVREPLDGGFAAPIAQVLFFEAKIGKEGFSIAQCKFAGFDASALHTRVRLIIEAYKEPLQLASPEEKRAHQLRRFESWSKPGEYPVCVEPGTYPWDTVSEWLRRSTRILAFFWIFLGRDVATSAWKEFGRCPVHPAPRGHRPA